MWSASKSRRITAKAWLELERSRWNASWQLVARVMSAINTRQRSSSSPRLPTHFFMQANRSAMIFSPPLAPVRLDPYKPAYMGRQAQCDLPLRHEDISRRHSEIRFEDGRFVLRDLGSTNGTFLNGEEIHGASPLSAGDKIEVGCCVVTFCEIDPGLENLGEDPDGAQTVVAERFAPPTEAFTGSLSEIPPFAVLQVLELGAKSGILEIRTDGSRCKIWFRQGAPIHAKTEKLVGFDAAISVVSAEVGSFSFEPQFVTEESTIECSVTELLLEGCRLADEAADETENA
jgi:pSer/pThr/pTyr-binding forkhead associated (FHA) protein